MKKRKTSSLLTAAAAVAGVAMGAGIAFAHPTIQLFTYDDVAKQMNGSVDAAHPYTSAANAPMPVLVDPTSKQGMPYSPKITCSGGGLQTGNCHSDNTTAVDANGHTLKGYTALADHAFHAALGYNEWHDNNPDGLWISSQEYTVSGATIYAGQQTGLAANKPWVQSHGHDGKW